MARQVGDRLALGFALLCVLLLAGLLLAATAEATPEAGEPQVPILRLLWTAGREYEGYCPQVGGYGWTGRLSGPTGVNVLGYNGGYGDTLDRTRPHSGLDFPAPVGAPVYAAATGVVIWAGPSMMDPGIVILAHGNGWTTIYAHLSSTGVACGQQVARGQQIGRSGEKAYPHLHLMLARWLQVMDPEPYFGGPLPRLTAAQMGLEQPGPQGERMPGSPRSGAGQGGGGTGSPWTH